MREQDLIARRGSGTGIVNGLMDQAFGLRCYCGPVQQQESENASVHYRQPDVGLNPQ